MTMRGDTTTKASDPEAVDAFPKRQKHPLIALAKALRARDCRRGTGDR
jgi:hypothetical protein